jgi:hypothetical protein
MATKKRAAAAKIGQLNVRLPEPLLIRLGVYLAHHRELTQKTAVADALDEYLKKRGA